MWIFSITPDWIFHSLLGASIVAMILGFIFGKAKLIQQYTLLLKIGGSIGLVVALFLEGALFD